MAITRVRAKYSRTGHQKQGFFARKTPVFLLLNAFFAFLPPNHPQKIKGSKEPFYNVVVTRSDSGSVDPGLGVIDISPSTCSSKLGLTDCHIGSKIKSIPSLRACFAAGTKSLSPAINTILSTCLLYAMDKISSPIRISTPFCVMLSEKSDCDKSSTLISPRHNFLVVSAERIYPRSLSSNSPRRIATFRFVINSLKKVLFHSYVGSFFRSIVRFNKG